MTSCQPVPSFELRSDDVAHEQMLSDNHVFDGFGMTGGNISPSLSWSGFPAETKSFAVTVFDPDAPTGSGILALGRARHPRLGDRTGDGRGRNRWLWPAQGGVPRPQRLRRQGLRRRGPPAGDEPHRYVFAVHALDVESLDVDDEISPAVAGFNLRFHTIARAVLIPVYGH